MPKAGRGSDQFPLRLPDGMRDKIKRKAKAAGRTMNAEIVERLEDSLGFGGSEGERFYTQINAADATAEAIAYLKRALELLTLQEK